MKKKRQISLQECYAILKIDNNATLEDVKKAYRKLAFELHPDLNPNVADASYQFQRLNEAYVALSQILQTEEGARKAEAKREEEKQKAESKSTQEKAYNNKTKQEEQAQQQKTEEKKAKEQKAKAQTTQEQTQAQKHRQRAASAAYAKEDVLRDLLHDPFARRVFEDIYSEVNKQTKPNTSPPPPPPPPPPPKQSTPPEAPPTVEVEIGDSNTLSHVANNFSGKIMGWFRQQIDEEQKIKVPASSLYAGARIRLQIRRGLSDELSTVEIVLPKDFVVGKPIRLRGLGKKVGKWQGDLYLTIECIQKTK